MRTILLLAQTPPPHHGQSRMVQMVHDVLEASDDWQVRHVNLRVSPRSEDIGEPQPGKLWALLCCAGHALGVILRDRPEVLYYVPAPGRPVPMLRDALLLPWVRLLVPKTVFHWQAVGLSEQVEALPAPLRALVRAIYRRPALSLVQSPRSGFDAAYFASRGTTVLPNGLPDAFPDAAEVMAARAARLAEPGRERTLLYLSNLQREKGVLAAIAAAHRLAEAQPIHLILAGGHVSSQESAEINEALQHPGPARITYAGFADEDLKRELLAAADVLVFPTLYRNEGFPLVLIEALSAGLPIVTTRWRGIPDLLPEDYPHYVPDQSATAVAQSIAHVLASADMAFQAALRQHYTAHYASSAFAQGLLQALQAALSSEV